MPVKVFINMIDMVNEVERVRLVVACVCFFTRAVSDVATKMLFRSYEMSNRLWGAAVRTKFFDSYKMHMSLRTLLLYVLLILLIRSGDTCLDHFSVLVHSILN